jgi:excisionase family DNA binding protein
MFSCIRWQPSARQEREPVEPLALSVNDAARVLGLGRTSIYAMIDDGRLEKFKLGRRTLIKTSSIRRLVDSQD